jgi:hypothetical protein
VNFSKFCAVMIVSHYAYVMIVDLFLLCYIVICLGYDSFILS